MSKKGLCTIALLLCISFLLCSCADMLFTTAEYRTYSTFCRNHKAGTTKQSVIEKLGCPDGYWDEAEAYHHIPYAEQENAVEQLVSADARVWVYECWKYSDPADPYRLYITFDSEGKSTETKMEPVPGG